MSSFSFAGRTAKIGAAVALFGAFHTGCSENEPADESGDGDSTTAGDGDGDGTLPGDGDGDAVVPGDGDGDGDTPVGTGGTTGTGGTLNTGGIPELHPLDTPLVDRIGVSDVTVAAGVQEGVRNWRVWSSTSLNIAPVYTVPLPNCSTLVCYTSGSSENSAAHVIVLDGADEIVTTHDVGPGFECRGLAAEPDGHFAVLLWDKDDRIYLERFDSEGNKTWGAPTELTNSDNKPTDFGIGESRVEFGDGKYGAYYHVHSDTGHEGDTLKYVDASTGAESTEWGWGCSHSMSELLRYNPSAGFMSSCVTDCFPGTSGDFSTNSIGGIYIDHNTTKVIDVDAGCNGSVAGELGSAAISDSGWKMVFNAHQAAAGLGQDSYNDSKNQDIGFTSIGGDLGASSVVWLTSTPDEEEEDSSIARFVMGGATDERYMVGWREQSGSYKLTLVDPAGALLSPVEDVTAQAQWGKRDDPFRRAANDDVVWAWFDSPGSTTLRFARVDAGSEVACGTQ